MLLQERDRETCTIQVALPGEEIEQRFKTLELSTLA